MNGSNNYTLIRSNVTCKNPSLMSCNCNYLTSNFSISSSVSSLPRILEYIKPQYVHMMVCGKIVKTGGYNLAFEIEKKGYSDTSVIDSGESNE